MKNTIKKITAISFFSLSALFPQVSALELPEGGTFTILVENVPEKSPVSQGEIESVVKLRLRRNGVEYTTENTTTDVGYLYINLNVQVVDLSRKLYVYSVGLEFSRNNLYQLHWNALKPELPIRSTADLKAKGLGPFHSGTVYNKSFLAYTNVSPSKDIKETIESVVDLFCSDFLDANTP